jgi:hypothetical protein
MVANPKSDHRAIHLLSLGERRDKGRSKRRVVIPQSREDALKEVPLQRHQMAQTSPIGRG